MREVWGLSPECMDAVDHSGHVLLVVDVRGLREEGLEEKPAVTPLGTFKQHHIQKERAESQIFLSILGCVLLCCLGLLD